MVGSGQATLRHTGRIAYRCFLPDLTGFTGARRTRPGLRHLPPGIIHPNDSAAVGDSAPHIADFGRQGTANAPPSTTHPIFWRRERDSNPRGSFTRLHDFQSCTFSRSAISPVIA